MFEEGDYDIIEVFDSVVFVEVVENLFSIHFNSSQDNQYPRWVEMKMLAFQNAFLPIF